MENTEFFLNVYLAPLSLLNKISFPTQFEMILFKSLEFLSILGLLLSFLFCLSFHPYLSLLTICIFYAMKVYGGILP